MKKILLLGILLVGCIDPYSPPEIEQAQAALVIDGFINVLGKSTIKLSRTQNLADTNEPIQEVGASIWVEDEQELKFFLSEESAGVYSLPAQSFVDSRYRLHIVTSNSKEYVSAFERAMMSPPIDSVNWSFTDDLGIQLFVNTNNTESTQGYYRWTFEETWLYTSAFQSTYVYNEQTRSAEVRTDDIYNCWRTGKSSDVLIESTTRLSENRVSEYPLTSIKQNDERLRYKYSILVKQYSITQDAFNYWQQIKKTTEDLGTLFGPLPSQVTGNFKSISNPAEPVIGYFAIGSFASNRIFIPWQELKTPPSYDIPYQGCESYQLFNENVPSFSGPFILTFGIPNPNGPGIIGYYYGSASCVDCRLSGGVNVQPDFWE
jgi:hypothetical protein